MIDLKINDCMNIKDNIDEHTSLKGKVIFKDALTGEVLGMKDNLILLRLRSYVLELLFGLTPNSSLGYNTSHTRKICLFKIGNGGADLTNSPFESIAPKFKDTDMYNPIPFIVLDPNKETDPAKEANPSFVTSLTNEQKHKFYLPQNFPDNTTRYFGKTFDPNTTQLVVNNTTGECYVRTTLSLDIDEARGFIYNELGLVMADYNSSNNTYSNAELVSHVTFDSDSIKSLNRKIIIEYLIYA